MGVFGDLSASPRAARAIFASQRRRRLLTVLLGATALTALGAGPAWSQTATLTPLQSVGSDRTFVHGISGDGTVVVGNAEQNAAVIWTDDGTATVLPNLPGPDNGQGAAFAANFDGSVVVGVSLDEAFSWTAAGGTVDLGVQGRATGVDYDGGVIVGQGGVSGDEDTVQAFRWTEATGAVGLGFLDTADNANSEATGVNSDGSVVVGLASINGNGGFENGNGGFQFEAFRWTAATGMVGLGFLDPSLILPLSSASAVDADGDVVVGSSLSADGSHIEPFRWTTAGGMVGLGWVNGGGGDPFGDAEAVDGDGSIIVGFSTDNTGQQVAFRWASSGPNAGMKSLPALLTAAGVDMSGITETNAVGISADGQFIALEGYPGSDPEEGFVVRYIDGGPGIPTLTTPVLDLPAPPAPRTAFAATPTTGFQTIAPLAGGGQFVVANKISGDGTTVVGRSSYTETGLSEAFLWTAAGGTQGLGFLTPGNPLSTAFGVDSDGGVVVGDSNNSTTNVDLVEAFRWTAATGMQPLGYLAGATILSSEAIGVSSDGSVIVGSSYDSVGREQAFRWTAAGGMQD